MIPLRHWQQPAAQDPTMLHCAQQRGRPDAASPTAATVRLPMRRSDPGRDPEPHWETYLASRHPGDRLLDALHHVTYVDGSPSFRRSCAHGVCGSCLVYGVDGRYVGPATIDNAHRFIVDSRDTAASERLELRQGRDDVYRCRTTSNCTDACPRGIQVTQAIVEVRRAVAGARM